MYKYVFNNEDCWYKNSCKQFHTNSCDASCIRYMEMHYLMQTSCIPKIRQYATPLVPDKKDVKAFQALMKIKEDIVNFTNNGESVYVYSEYFGNGKTSWAIKLMQKYFDEIWAGNGFRCRGIFIHVPTFLTKIKENISFGDNDFETMRQRLTSVDLVIWDDIASAKLSEFDHVNLLTYIDNRQLNGLANIYTGNLNGEDLPGALGNRLASRVWKDSCHIEFVGRDRRGTRW